MRAYLFLFLFIFLVQFQSHSFGALIKKKVNLDALNETFAIISEKYYKEISTETLVYSSLEGVLKNLDPYSDFFSPDDKQMMLDNETIDYKSIGIDYIKYGPFIKVILVADNMPAFRSGIKPNDLIMEINDQNVEDLSIYQVQNLVRDSHDNKVKIKYMRYNKENGEREIDTVIIDTEILPKRTVEYKTIDNFAIFKINVINQNTYQEFLELWYDMISKRNKEFQNKSIDGLILDLRNNPGGFLDQSVDISSLFLTDKSLIVSVIGYKTNNKIEYYSNQNINIGHKFPIVVLINKGSASGAEIIAAALQENNRAVLIGEKSFGKGSVQELFDLDSISGAAIKITTGFYYTPNGTKIDKIGLIPDIEIPDYRRIEQDNFTSVKTINNKKTKDEILETALLLLKNKQQYNEIISNKTK